MKKDSALRAATDRSTQMDPARLQEALRAHAAGDERPLEELCRQTLNKWPADRVAHATLCQILTTRDEFSDAIEVLHRALEQDSDDPYIHLNLSHCYLSLRQHQLAQNHAKKACELHPNEARNWLNLSSACYHVEDLEPGAEAALRALELQPNLPGALTNLGTIRKAQGQVRESIGFFRRALQADPQRAMMHTNLLLAMLYDEDVSADQVKDVALGFARQFEEPLKRHWKPHSNLPLPERRLRVGFVSPDFTSHAVMYFAEPVITRLPRQQFEVFCYSTVPAGDSVTQRVKSLADRFRNIPEHQPDTSAGIIRDDQIDVLIDLAGHTAKTGLPAFAYRPAPVQVTWLGYPGTTGLESIQWRITDHTADPQDADSHYTEKLVRMPGCFAVYRPHIRHHLDRFDERYEVARTPALSNGFITFGSCNNIAKVGERCIDAWSRILRLVPGSKMLIEGKDFAKTSATQRLRTQFAAHGIDEERLIFVPRDTRRQYLTYHDIDIALDTFPLTGGTTTFDCLWMGVPIVSIIGKTFRERLSTSILYHGGFKEDLCADVDAYVARAVALAADVPALQARRSGQRVRMQTSVLMDEARYVRLFAQSLRMIWREWCREQLGATPAGTTGGELEAGLFVSVDGRRWPLARARQELEAWWNGAQSRAEPVLARQRALALAALEVMPESELAARVLQTVDNASMPTLATHIAP